MKNNYDLIAFDMDGTLLDSNKQIQESSLKAIHEATAMGKHVVLSTGRCIPELVKPLGKLSVVKYAIAVSGALIYDYHAKKEIYSCEIPTETVLTMMEMIGDMDVMMHIHSIKSVVQRDKEQHMADYNLGVYQEMFDEVSTLADNIKAYYENELFPVFKFNLHCKTLNDRDILKEKFSHLPLVLCYSEKASLECSAPNVSKGEGLKRLCQYLNVPIERTIAVGDADNDLGILRTAGLSIGMGNANENVKAIADVIVNDNNSGGCAQAIYEYLI